MSLAGLPMKRRSKFVDRCALLLLGACLPLAPVHADGRAPAAVLERGEPVPAPASWRADDDTPLEANTNGKVPFPSDAERLASGPVRLKPGHAYRIEVPVESGHATELEAGVTWNGAEQLFWPTWHRSSALRPRDTLTGIVIAHQPEGAGEVYIARANNDVEVTLGQVRIHDLGEIRGHSPGPLLRCSFEHWDDAGRPACIDSIAFAEPGQFGPSDESAADDGHSAHNTDGRAMLFGNFIDCRFGSVLRASVRVRGSGSVELRVIPYLDQRQRGVPPTTVSAEAGEQWKTLELIVAQNNPKADHVRFTLDIEGTVYVDELTIEVLPNPAPSD